MEPKFKLPKVKLKGADASKLSGAVNVAPAELFIVKLFIFLLEGISAPSLFKALATLGANQPKDKLYTAILAVGAVATVVKVPAVPRIPTVGAVK